MQAGAPAVAVLRDLCATWGRFLLASVASVASVVFRGATFPPRGPTHCFQSTNLPWGFNHSCLLALGGTFFCVVASVGFRRVSAEFRGFRALPRLPWSTDQAEAKVGGEKRTG